MKQHTDNKNERTGNATQQDYCNFNKNNNNNITVLFKYDN